MDVRSRNNTRNRRALVAFSLAGIPAGSTINSATLELYATATEIDRTVDVHHATGAWAEGTVTWATMPTFGASPDASAAMGTTTGWKSWDVQAVVQAWVSSGYANNGLLLKDTAEGSSTNDTWTFATKENGTAANRPILRVNYTPPSGGWDCSYVGAGTCAVCAAPTVSANNAAADVSACAASGVEVTWSADPAAWGDTGGTRTYDVLRDGLPLQAGIAYGTTSFTDTTASPGVSYSYAVQYNNGCGLSATTAGATAADADETPAPAVTGAASNTCPAVSVVLSTQAGMSSYQWYLDGSPLGGATADTVVAAASGDYAVEVTNASGCTALSPAHTVTLAVCPLPGEVAPGDTAGTSLTWPDKVSLSWPGDPAATGYRLYRGALADLPNLLDGADDSCLRYADSPTTTAVGDDPTAVPGGFYWYLVTGTNPTGEGPAGNATAGPRVVNSTGPCL